MTLHFDLGDFLVRACLIRIEGCNFAATLLDTDDLSTIRGASLAYLRLANAWPALLDKTGLPGVTPVVIGASDGIYRVEADDGISAVRKKIAEAIAAPPLLDDDLEAVRPHLAFSAAAIEESANYRDDVLRLTALCRAGQLQQPTVDIPPFPSVTEPCFVDRVRPGDAAGYQMPDGARAVSGSVKARREYGRKARQAFYESELGAQLKYDFANSFAELAANNPPGLPPSLESKMAVVYLDGNKFTAIRENVVFGARNDIPDVAAVRERQHTFSHFIRDARRQLLGAILRHLSAQPGMLYTPKRVPKEDTERLKFETLLWGGDESLFVLPAWALMDLLPELADELEKDDWEYPNSGYKLSHAVGIAICNIKTPINVAKRHAEDVANEAKTLLKDDPLKAMRNVYSLQIFESIESPRADLGAFREHLYGTKSVEAFSLTGAADVKAMRDHIQKFQDTPGGLPRSQLYKLINAARKQSLLGNGNACEAEKFIGENPKPGEQASAPVPLALERSKSALKVADLRSPLLGYTSSAPLVPLMRLAELWDYVDPLGLLPDTTA
jgi:hypothetical protein